MKERCWRSFGRSKHCTRGTKVDGEREAARRAAERIRTRLTELRGRERETEYRYTLHDPWKRKLFLALCRRYGHAARARLTIIRSGSPRHTGLIYTELDTVGNVRRLHTDSMLHAEGATGDLGGYSYSAFGKSILPSAPGGLPAPSVSQPFRWQGKRLIAANLYLAEKVSEGIYRILDQEYDQDIEKWEFSPGAEVICTVLDGSAGPILAAIAHV